MLCAAATTATAATAMTAAAAKAVAATATTAEAAAATATATTDSPFHHLAREGPQTPQQQQGRCRGELCQLVCGPGGP